MLFLGVCQWRRPQNAPIFCDFSIGHLILKTLEASKKNEGFDPKPNLGGGLEHFFMTFHILRIITPTDFHMFQRGRAQPPTRNISKHWVEIPSRWSCRVFRPLRSATEFAWQVLHAYPLQCRAGGFLGGPMPPNGGRARINRIQHSENNRFLGPKKDRKVNHHKSITENDSFIFIYIYSHPHHKSEAARMGFYLSIFWGMTINDS